MGLELWETVKKAIEAYTGVSAVTFFTAIALGLVIYHVVFGLFGSSNQQSRSFDDEMEPLPPPVQLGEITEDDLKLYDGSDPKKPLLMAIKGQIYDVSQSRMFYGPGGPYALFAGKDASRALAKMSFEEKDLTGDISGLGPFELEALQDWEYKFMSKYVKVGTLKKDDAPPITEGSSSGEPSSESTKATYQAIPTPDEGGSEEKPAEAGVETTCAEGADKKDEQVFGDS